MASGHLKPEEREVVSQMLSVGASHKEIGKLLGRHRTTISREVRRNSFKGVYFAVDAQRCAERRRASARAKSRKMCLPENQKYVQERLRKCWSPDQIAGRSQLDFPGQPRQKFSHQTVYTWIKNDDHSRRWKKFLRQRPRRRRLPKSPGRTDRALAERPDIINQRGRWGDWEGDTIVGPGCRGANLISLVDRKSRYLMLLPVENRKAEKVRRSICGRMQQLPAELRNSLTFDNGSEFAEYEAMEQALQLKVFFTDPHSPWQRGTNENTNGLVRQFFPKGTDLKQLSRYKVAKVEKLLNDRPRKTLGYRTPSEVQALQGQCAFQT